MKFPIESELPIQNSNNTGAFSKFTSPSATAMKVVAPADGYVFFYRLRPGIPTTEATLTHYPAIHENTGNGYIAFVPERADYFSHITRRRFPTISHLVCQYAAPTQPASFDDFKIASNLIRNYHSQYPSRGRISILQVDSVSGRRVPRHFDISRLSDLNEESSEAEKTRVFDEVGQSFHHTFWAANPTSPVMLPVKEGDLIYRLQPTYDAVSLSLVNHCKTGSGTSTYFTRFYIDLNHYYQILINNSDLNMSSEELNKLHYGFQSGAEARNTLSLPVGIKYEPGEYPNNTDHRVQGLTVRVVGGLQNINLEIKDWYWGREIKVPVEILTCGLVEATPGQYAEVRFSQDINHRITNNTFRREFSTDRTVINESMISQGNDVFEELNLWFVFRPVVNSPYPTMSDSVNVVLYTTYGLLNKVGEHVNEISTIQANYTQWLNRSCTFAPYKKNIDFVHLFEIIRIVRYDNRINLSNWDQHVGSSYRQFEDQLYGRSGFKRQSETLVGHIRPVFDDDAVFSALLLEFQFGFDFTQLSLADIDVLERSLETIEYLYESLYSVDGASAILDRITNHFYSQTSDVPIESALPMSFSQLYKLSKLSRKCGSSALKITSRVVIGHFVKIIKEEGFSNIWSSDSVRQYTAVLNGFRIQPFVDENGDTVARYTRPEDTPDTRSFISNSLKVFDVIFAYIDLLTKLDSFTRNSSMNNGTDLIFASTKFLFKVSRSLVSQSSRTSYALLNRGLPIINALSAMFDISRAADAISDYHNRGNADAEIFRSGEIVGNSLIIAGEVMTAFTPFVLAGETASALAILGPVGAFLIVGGVILCIGSYIATVSVDRLRIEEYVRYSYFGSNTDPLPPAYRLFENNIDVQVAYLNSIYFPIEVTPFSIDANRLVINCKPALVSNTSSIAIFIFNEGSVFVDACLHRLNFSNGQSTSEIVAGRNIHINATSPLRDGTVLEFSISIGDYISGSANIQVNDIDKVLLIVSFGEVGSETNTPRKLSRSYSATSRVEIKKD
jgi:hypothetical protein